MTSRSTWSSPRGSFTYELAIPFAGVVPASTPSKNQTQHPPPGAGRYVIRNVEQGRGYSLVRNPHFSPGLKGTAVDVAKVNGINVKINSSISAQVTQIANNQADFMIDNPTADRAGEVRAKYTGQALSRVPDDLDLLLLHEHRGPALRQARRSRQAVNWALDFDAINRIQAGFLSKTHGILPQQIPGYEPSPDLYPGPNLQKAQQLIAQAGAKGAQVTVWSDNEDPTPQTMAYYTDLLNKIGLKAKLKTVAAQTYFAGGRRPLAQGPDRAGRTGPRTTRIRRTSSTCCSTPPTWLPRTTTTSPTTPPTRAYANRINAVAAKPLNSQTEKEWAALDRYAQQQAYWGVYGTRKQSTFFSDRMNFQNCKGDDWPLATHDWGRFCLK